MRFEPYPISRRHVIGDVIRLKIAIVHPTLILIRRIVFHYAPQGLPITHPTWKNTLMRRTLIYAALVTGLFALNNLRNVDGDEAAAPALPAANQKYTPDPDFDGIIQTKIVLETGDNPNSLNVVSRPTVISRHGKTATVEISGSDGKTIRFDIVSEVVHESTD